MVINHRYSKDYTSHFNLKNLILLPNTGVWSNGNSGAIEENPILHLSFSLSKEEIDGVIEAFYTTYPQFKNSQETDFTAQQSFLLNEIAINHILERMIFLYTENHPSRDVFVDFLQKEMVIRLI